MDLKKNLPYIILLISVVAGVTFAAVKFLRPAKPASQDSRQTADASQNQPGSSADNRFGQGGGTGRTGQGRGNFQRLHGTIASINGQTIVMTADDKSTKNLNCTSSTRISEQENGQMTQLALADLKAGDEINVMGGDTTQSDITPRMIIIGTFAAPQNGGSWQRPNSGSSNQDNSGQSSDGSSNQI